MAIVTLGCARNEVDSAQAAGALAAAGYDLVEDPATADAVLVNTCAFVEAAKRESVETVLDAAELKRTGAAGRVVVMGCMAERYTRELRAELPEADAVVPFADYGRLAEIVAGAPDSTPPSAVVAASAQPQRRGRMAVEPAPGRRRLPMLFPSPADAGFPARPVPSGPVAHVKLGEGCDRECSFCAIPSFRGGFRSRPPQEILREVTWLVSHGVAEVCLVAENSTSYGKDLGGRAALVQLLGDLAGIAGLRRLRLNYLQPDELTPRLLEEMAVNPVVCSYFDLSLQHASLPVLRRMRRGGSAPAFLDLVEHIRALDPDAAFRSNFILGFPGETARDVAALEVFLEAARLDWVAFFAYSPEDGTAARSLAGRVPARTARARVERLSELQDQILAEVQQGWIGRRLEVLVDRVEPDGSAEGRSFREAPEHDGVVRLAGGAGSLAVGDFVQAEIVAADGPELEARLLARVPRTA